MAYSSNRRPCGGCCKQSLNMSEPKADCHFKSDTALALVTCRNLVKEFHTDKTVDDAEKAACADVLRLWIAANETLCDADNRSLYHRLAAGCL